MKVPCTNEHDLMVLALANLHEKREKLVYAGEPVVEVQDQIIVELATALREPEQDHP